VLSFLAALPADADVEADDDEPTDAYLDRAPHVMDAQSENDRTL
jgi:hypothetical protein